MRLYRSRSLILCFAVVSVLVVHVAQAAGATCEAMFSSSERTTFAERTVAESIFEQIKNYEDSISNARKLNGGKLRSNLNQMIHRRYVLVENLRYRDVNASTDLYRSLFRDVEVAYWNIKGGVNLKRAYQNLGRNYGEYSYIRKLLEKLALESNADSAADAQSILRGLGSTSTARLLPGLAIPTERPPLEAVAEVFKTHPEALFAKLKHDLKNERVLAFKSLIFGILHLESAQRLLYKILPNAYVAPVTELIGLSYNSYVLNKYFVDIERVLMSPNSAELKLNLLMEVNSKFSTSDELLVTFARMMSQSAEWSRLHTTAKELAASSKGADNFSDRMTKAETKARTMGDLPRFEDSSIVDRVAAAAVPIAGFSYAIFADHPWLTLAADYLKTSFGF